MRCRVAKSKGRVLPLMRGCASLQGDALGLQLATKLQLDTQVAVGRQ